MAGIYDLGDSGARSEFAARREAAGIQSPFSSLAYVEAAAQAYGLHGQIHLADPDAGAVIFVRGLGPTRRGIIPPFSQYSSIVLPAIVPEQSIHARTSPLERILESIETVCPRADLLCRLGDPRPAKWRSWQVSPVYTYLLNTASDPSAWSASARRIQQTQSVHFECRETVDLAASVIELCRRSYARHGRKMPGGAKSVLDMVQRLGGLMRVFVALRRGMPEAGIIVLHSGIRAHYWISGSKPGPAMTVLIGHLLPTLRNSGIEILDFVGANTPSIAEFKRRFAPRLDLYFHLRRHPLARLIT